MRLLPLALIVACSGTTGPGPSKDDSTPTGSTVEPGTPTGATATGPTGEVGHMVYWWEDRGGGGLPTEQIAATFAPNFDGLAAPAPCGMIGRLCVAELPATDGTWIDSVETSYDAIDVGTTWVGNTLSAGGFEIPFLVIPSTGFGGYRAQIAGSALPVLDVIFGGEWGDWTGLDVLPNPEPLLGLTPEPGEFINAEDSLDLSWTPNIGSAVVYLEVTSPTGGGRIWRFADTGSLSIPSADLPPLNAPEIYDVALYQVVSADPQDANGNTIQGQAWSVASWPVGLGGAIFSCQGILDDDPTAPSGMYMIQPDPAQPSQSVYCDMTTDGGGWTLVASSRDSTFDDAAVGYSPNLETTTPTTSMNGIWSGMRTVITGLSDIRFTCKKQVAAPDMFVDLSFYDIGWYQTITTGTDNDSCFSDNQGVGAGPPPARRNNKTGASLAAGDQWNTGYLEGEDSCSDTGDFTVDFDDRGMDSNQSDGTDWGEDDSSQKCGDASVANGGAWFIWVRE